MSSRFLSGDFKPGTLRSGTFGPGSWQMNVAVVAAGIATFINMYCTQSILPVLADAFHVPQAQTGLSVTAPLLATAMVAPVVGAISDRFGRKRLILGAASLLVIPTALAADAGNFEMFVFWRFVQGLMLPFIFTVTIAYIGDESEGPMTARLAGIYMAGTITGGFSGRLITGFATQFMGWRGAMLVVAAITFSMAMVVAVMMRREQRFKAQYGIGRALKSFPIHLSNPRLLATFAVGFGVLFSLIAVFTYVNFRLAAAPYFLGPAALGSIFVVYLGGVVMSPLAGRLANRFGRRRVMAAAAPILVLGLMITLAAPLWMIIVGLLMFCSGVFVQQTVGTAFVSQAAREAKSTAVGLYVMCYYIGGSAGGILPAGVWHSFGWPGCVAIVCAMQAMMLAVAMRYWTPLTS
ncbi:MAG: MFS transporter [Acidocella sp.]|nr:MFS transporter [Acidocella sp.]